MISILKTETCPPTYVTTHSWLVSHRLSSSSHGSWDKLAQGKATEVLESQGTCLTTASRPVGECLLLSGAHTTSFMCTCTKPSQQLWQTDISLFYRSEIKACRGLLDQAFPGWGAEPGLKPRFLLPKSVPGHIWGKNGTWKKGCSKASLKIHKSKREKKKRERETGRARLIWDLTS